MSCTGCGNQPAVIGRFCTSCDNRARRGSFERRRPVGGSQWQALWGIDYGARAGEARHRRLMQYSIAFAVIGVAVFFSI